MKEEYVCIVENVNEDVYIWVEDIVFFFIKF